MNVLQMEKLRERAEKAEAAQMNEQKARKILGERVQDDGSLQDSHNWLDWGAGDNTVSLDGDFSADELEAIAWWVRQ